MAISKSQIERAAKVGSPAGTLGTPPKASVPPGTQSQARALRRAMSAEPPTTLKGTVESYLGGPPEELLSERQFARQQLEQAQEAYLSQKPFEPQQFTQRRPAFDANAVAKLMPNLLVMATLGGQSTRGNALGMLKSMTAGIKGLQEGNERAYQQALADYDRNYTEFTRREAVRQKQYDLLREGAKDGVAVAASRYQMASQAVNDWNKQATNDIKWMSTVEANARAAQKAGARVSGRGDETSPAGLARMSAINFRFQQNVLRSSREVLRTIDDIQKMSIGGGANRGILGSVMGHGTVSSEVAAAMAQRVTSEKQKIYNSVISGLGTEMGFIMNGGQKPLAGQMREFQNMYGVGPSDSEYVAARKLATVVQVVRSALIDAPDFTEQQKKSRLEILKALERYDTPEQIDEKFSNPVSSSLTPAEAARLAALRAKARGQ